MDPEDEIGRNKEFYRTQDVRPPFTYAALIRQVNISITQFSIGNFILNPKQLIIESCYFNILLSTIMFCPKTKKAHECKMQKNKHEMPRNQTGTICNSSYMTIKT